MPVVAQNKFYGGLADDVRQESSLAGSFSSHFDIWSNPYRLTPFRSMSAADATTGSNIRNFYFASDGKMYAVGVSPSTTKMRLFSSPWDAFTSWTTIDTSVTETQVTGVNGGFNVLIEYKDYLWGIHGSGLTKVWKYGPLSSSPTYTEVAQTITPSTGASYTRCGGAIIGADDNLYILLSGATANDVVKINSTGTASVSSVVLPATEKGIALAQYGSYLAIGTVNPAETSVTNSVSKIYLWDYISSDISDKINCPDGALVGMGNVDGQLITVHRIFRSAFGSSTTYTFCGVLSGSEIQVFKTIPNVTPTSSRVQVYSGNLYFGGLHSSDYLKSGIYAIGRPTANYPWNVTLEYQAVASASTTNPSAINGFHIADDYMWVSHSTDNVTKVLNSATYSSTSTFESLINPNMPSMDRTKMKKLQAISVSYVPLPTAGQVVLKYSVDGSAYTTIFTETTNGVLKTEATAEATGTPFQDGIEFQFKVESTGFAEITEIKYRYENIASLV
jgi:hypothetical protein